MLYQVQIRNKKVGTIQDFYTDDKSVFILDVNESVKVSEHHHQFIEWRVLTDYLDWLFGEEKWNIDRK